MIEEVPQCPYCPDVAMDMFTKDRNWRVCPSCFTQIPREQMTSRERRRRLDSAAAV